MIGRMVKPLHLTASMKVVRAHQRRRHITVDDARQAVLDAAYSMAQGNPGHETLALVEKLQKVTGISISELAVFADQWPEME